MSLNLRRNVKYEMFGSLTYSCALLGLGANTRCLPVCQAHYCSWCDIARYSFTRVSSKVLSIHVVDQGADELSAFRTSGWVLEPHLYETPLVRIMKHFLVLCQVRQ